MTLMELLKLFWGFFVANVLGYGGGPSSIPLMEEEIVNHYQWLTPSNFIDVLALGNALPGPIATKIAAYVGFKVFGWSGVLVALAATIIPSAIALVFLLRVLNKYRQSHVVKGMTLLVQPVIAVMMVVLTWQFGRESIHGIGALQSIVIAAVALFAMTKGKIHPALVIVAAFLYGGIVISQSL